MIDILISILCIDLLQIMASFGATNQENSGPEIGSMQMLTVPEASSVCAVVVPHIKGYGKCSSCRWALSTDG